MFLVVALAAMKENGPFASAFIQRALPQSIPPITDFLPQWFGAQATLEETQQQEDVAWAPQDTTVEPYDEDDLILAALASKEEDGIDGNAFMIPVQDIMADLQVIEQMVVERMEREESKRWRLLP